jgi:hypothetical protein
MNDYRPASCMTLAVYGADLKESILKSCNMAPVPNRPGWYFYRYPIPKTLKAGLYTAIITSITRIDGNDYSNRNMQEFRVLDDDIQ